MTSNDRLRPNRLAPESIRGIRHHFLVELPALRIHGDHYKNAKAAFPAFEALAALPQLRGTVAEIKQRMGKVAFEGLKSYLSCVRYGLVDYYVFGAGTHEPQRVFLPEMEEDHYRLELLDREDWESKAQQQIKRVTKRRGNPIRPGEAPISDEQTPAEEATRDLTDVDEAFEEGSGGSGAEESGFLSPTDTVSTAHAGIHQNTEIGAVRGRERPPQGQAVGRLAAASGFMLFVAILLGVWWWSKRPSTGPKSAPSEEVAVGVAFFTLADGDGRKLVVPEHRGEIDVINLAARSGGDVQLGALNRRKLAMALVSSMEGHFYLFDREIYQDNSLGDSFALYPTHGLPGHLDAGMPVMLPAEGAFWDMKETSAPKSGNKNLKGEEFLLLYTKQRWTNFPSISGDERFDPKLLPGARVAMELPTSVKPVNSFVEIPGGAILQTRFRLGESSIGGLLRLSASTTKEGIAALRLRILY